MNPTPAVVPVIMEIVGSRTPEEREASQRTIESTFTDIAGHVQAPEDWEATVGDESQPVHPTIPDALRATLMLRLALPEDSDCRFGIGFGTIRSVASQGTARIQDGPGWWAARAAIDEARRRGKARNPTLHAWFQDLGEDAAASIRSALVNSCLLARGQVISTVNPRTRSRVAGRMLWFTQAEAARAHDVSQSAVSQGLKDSGAAALLSSLELFKAAIESQRKGATMIAASLLLAMIGVADLVRSVVRNGAQGQPRGLPTSPSRPAAGLGARARWSMIAWVCVLRPVELLSFCWLLGLGWGWPWPACSRLRRGLPAPPAARTPRRCCGCGPPWASWWQPASCCWPKPALPVPAPRPRTGYPPLRPSGPAAIPHCSRPRGVRFPEISTGGATGSKAEYDLVGSLFSWDPAIVGVGLIARAGTSA